MYVKGAPDVLLPRCTAELTASGPHPLQTQQRDRIERAYLDFGARGLRGLLVASRSISRTEFESAGDPRVTSRISRSWGFWESWTRRGPRREKRSSSATRRASQSG